MFISCFQVFSSAFVVRIRGQGARVPLGLCARLISSLLLLVLRRDCICAVSAPCSPCRLLLVLHKNFSSWFVQNLQTFSFPVDISIFGGLYFS